MVLKALLDLFYPPRCAFCNKLLAADEDSNLDLPAVSGDFLGPERFLCLDCARELSWIAKSCPRCAFPLEKGESVCHHCHGSSFSFQDCCALARYQGKMKETLHRFKYHGRKSLAEPLAALLYKKIISQSWVSSVSFLVPVPLSRQRFLERGYNQASLLAAALAGKIGLPVKEMLERVRDTKSQTGLSRKRRAENLSGAFRCLQKIPERSHILLVDDVLTSGATAHEAAKTLKGSGAGRISVAVLSR
jgi:ComF family protein